MRITWLRRLVLAAVLLACSATAAFAAGGHLSLAWNDCYGEPAAAFHTNFDCTGASAPVSLWASYTLNNAAPSVLTLTAVLDVSVLGVWTLPPFWHFEEGGCNAGFLSVSDARPSGMCPQGDTTLCRSTGGQCSEYVAYGAGVAAGLPADYRGRILVGLARDPSAPVGLAAAASTHFAFRLDFDLSNAVEAGGACAGCGERVGITLQTILLEGPSGAVDIVTHDMPGSLPLVCVNTEGGCYVATRKGTWGQLKALYR